MIQKNLRISLFLVLAICFAVYGQELERLCGKTDMEVSNKNFSFDWTITGYGARLNDASSFKLFTDKIVFNDMESDFWKFHITKRGHGIISLWATTLAQESKFNSRNFPTLYRITPEISIGDKVIQLETLISSSTPTYSFNSQASHFDKMHKHFNKWTKHLSNFTKQMQFMAEQNRFKSMASASPPKNPTIIDTSMNTGSFPNYHLPSQVSFWPNIFPQLTEALAQDAPKEMKIKFLIQATISKIEYTSVDCN